MINYLERIYLLGLIGGFLLSARPVLAQVSPGDLMPMADYRLMDGVTDMETSLGDVVSPRGGLIVFWSNQCVWADRYRARLDVLIEILAGLEIKTIFVNSNNEAVFPREEVSPSRARRMVHPYGVYLRDQGAALARGFGAARTPQVYLFGADRRLVYQGAIDDSPGDPDQVQQPYLAEAIEALKQQTTPRTTSSRPFGCQIKF